MDFLIFVGILAFLVVLVIIGLYKFGILVPLAGLFLLLLVFPVVNGEITMQVLNSTNTSFVYGNSTLEVQVLNESRNLTGFPFTFMTLNTPLVNGSNICYYTANATLLNSTIVNPIAGTINITG